MPCTPPEVPKASSVPAPERDLNIHGVPDAYPIDQYGKVTPNPSTGKPCGTVFSRPYDLTRHEDTIHSARKQKVCCDLCTDEKTFSRTDALTRHYRVCQSSSQASSAGVEPTAGELATETD